MADCPRAAWTVATLTAHGVKTVDASCPHCGTTWRPPISFLPAATTLDKIAALLVCPSCGRRGIDVDAPPEITAKLVH